VAFDIANSAALALVLKLADRAARLRRRSRRLP
jgi:hypothetical protein